MKHARQKIKNTESESPNKPTIRTVAGQEIAVVQSTSAAMACIQSCPQTVVLDCEQVSLPNRRFIQWFLNLTRDSCRLVITGSNEVPVAPIRIDGSVQKPLTDKKLKKLLTEFTYRDRYAAVLLEYMQCVWQNETSETAERQRKLEEQLTDLRTKLAEMNGTSDISAFSRTMREILQTEQSP